MSQSHFHEIGPFVLAISIEIENTLLDRRMSDSNPMHLVRELFAFAYERINTRSFDKLD